MKATTSALFVEGDNYVFPRGRGHLKAMLLNADFQGSITLKICAFRPFYSNSQLQFIFVLH